MVREIDQLEYALKRVKLNSLGDRELQNAINEVRLLASIKNSYIVSYKEAFIDEPSQSLW